MLKYIVHVHVHYTLVDVAKYPIGPIREIVHHPNAKLNVHVSHDEAKDGGPLDIPAEEDMYDGQDYDIQLIVNGLELRFITSTAL